MVDQCWVQCEDYQAEVERRRVAEAERDAWREEAWQCFCAAGEDPDGADARHLRPGEAKAAVEHCRQGERDCWSENDRLAKLAERSTERAEAAESKVAAVVAAESGPGLREPVIVFDLAVEEVDGHQQISIKRQFTYSIPGEEKCTCGGLNGNWHWRDCPSYGRRLGAGKEDCERCGVDRAERYRGPICLTGKPHDWSKPQPIATTTTKKRGKQ